MIDSKREKNPLGHPGSLSVDEKAAEYQKLITDHLPFIEKQCRRACALYKKRLPDPDESSRSTLEIENRTLQVISSDEIDPDTLVNQVIDRLKADQYKVFRDFQGQAKMTTYLQTIISNLVVDLVRRQRGRNRAKDRAKTLGPIGEKLYELVFEKGYPAEEAYNYLKKHHHIETSLHEIEEMVESLKGPRSREKSTVPDDAKPFVTKEDPEKELIREERKKLAQGVLEDLLSSMSDEEKMMIRMRFPASEEERPMELAEIARLLGINEKAVDSRIRRILIKCRKIILKKGLSLDDLIEA
ncbi:MAG: sigma-70 family RNA polymerase sigma factor [Desulfobacterota bacterium]|nr:sigma-70 family RNA polymerase sigma factor [Thermodesulfobacteriota bacterium]